MSPLPSKTAEGTRAPLCFRWLLRSWPAVTFPAPFGLIPGGCSRRVIPARRLKGLGGHPKAAIKGHLKTGQRK